MREKFNSLMAASVVAAGICLINAAPAMAQSGSAPNAGLFPGSGFGVNDIESINAVNGNLALSIPVAKLPPGPGGFSTGINLVYNSTLFDARPGPYESISGQVEAAAQWQQSTHGGGWQYSYNYTLWSQQRYYESYNDGNSTYPNCVGFSSLATQAWFETLLTTPDGSNHVLRLLGVVPASGSGDSRTLSTFTASASDTQESYYSVDFAGNTGHWCNSTNAPFSGTLVYATVDSTYIRVEANTSLSPPTWTAYFPDGTQVSGPIVTTKAGEAFDSDAGQITDRNGNTLSITRTCQSATECADQLTDAEKRSIQIAYGDSTATSGSWSDTITWPGVGATDTLQTTVAWQTDQIALTSPCSLCAVPTSITTVSSIQLPPASTGGAPPVYAFSYYSSNGEVQSLTWCSAYSTQTSCQQYQVQYTYAYVNGSGAAQGLAGNNFNPANPIATRALTYSAAAGGSPTLSECGNSLPDTSCQTTYSIPLTAPTPYYSSFQTSTITHPDGGVTAMKFANLCPQSPDIPEFCAPLVYQIQYPDNSLVNRYWESNIKPPGVPDSVFINPYVMYEIYQPGGAASAVAKGKKLVLDQFGNVTSIQENDWFPYASIPLPNTAENATLPGSLRRTTTTNYYPQSSDAPYWCSPTALMTAPPCNGIGAHAYLRAPQSTTVTNGAGNTAAITQFGYDHTYTTANLTSQQQWDSTTSAYITTAWTYLPNGNVQTITDPNGNITNFCYDNANLYATQVHVAASAAASSGQCPTGVRNFAYTYYSDGLPETVTDSDNSVTTTYTYDNLGRQKEEEQCTASAGVCLASGGLDRVAKTQYNDAALSVTVSKDQSSTSDQALVTQTSYDPLGRVQQSVDASGNTVQVSYQYPPRTGASFVLTSNPYASTADPTTTGWTLAAHDNMGRPTSVARFSGQTPPVPGATNNPNPAGATSANYNLLVGTSPSLPASKVIDEAGNSRTYAQDALGRVASVTESDSTASNSIVTTNTYDALDHLTSADVAGNAASRSFYYSSLGRLVCAANLESSTTNPCSSTTTSGADLYTYDANGNLWSHTDARGATTTWGTSNGSTWTHYDGLNRPSGKTYSIGTSAAAYTPPVVYTYDQDTKGTLSSVTATDSSNPSNPLVYQTSYTHDAFGRVTGSLQTTPNAPSAFQFGYTYTLSDQLLTETYPSGRQVAYTLGTTAQGNGGQVTGVNGTLGTLPTQYASGIKYTAAGGLSILPLGNTGVSEQHSWNHRFQPIEIQAGSLLDLHFYPCSGEQTDCGSGNNGNILQEKIGIGGSTKANREYQYDYLNRITLASENPTNSANPQCPDSGATWCQKFQYDTAGNRTSVSDSFPSNWDAPAAPFTTAKNQIETAGTNWRYDPAGNIIQDSINDTLAFDVEGRLTSFGSTSYKYDGGGQRVLQTDTTSGTTVFLYDATGNLAAEWSSTHSTASGTQYVVADDLGSTRLAMNAAGAATEQHDYTPFGIDVTYGTWRSNASVWVGSGAGVRPRFTGQEYDWANAAPLYHFPARFMSPNQGRFISPDPGNAGADMGDPQTWNGYSYVANNPLSYTDPSGLGFWSTLKSILIDLGLMAGSDVAEAWSGSSSNVQVSGDAGDATVNYGYGGADSFNWANPNYSLSVNSGANDYSGYLPLDLSYSGLSSSSSSPAGGTTKPAPSNGTPQASHSCLAQRVSNAIPGSQLTGGETAQGGHEQFNIATTPAQLSAAGFAPFKVLGIFSNGYRNGALFLQVHVNGQGGAELDGGSSGVLNVQGHFDVFNPAAGYGVGLLLHGIYDLGVGSLFFKHSAGLDPGC